MMRFRRSSLSALALASLIAVLPLGCDTGELFESGGDANLTVTIHDQVGMGISEAHVTFSVLEIRQADTGLWTTVTSGDMPTVDLLLLVDGKEATLTSSSIPPGDYDGMRLTIQSVSVVLTTGQIVDVPVPSSPVEILNFPLIRVGEDGSATVVLDFVVGDSFVVDSSGGVTMNPRIVVDRANAN